ncbi:MAG: DUF4810 domain-containing protein [Bacteroidales bacterium]|nr:DUF4810 domain-containing protein [Bacteroidales bacterium]
MKEINEEKTTTQEVSDFISKTELFFEKNQKTIYIVLAAIVIVVAGYFALTKWYFEPRSEEAAAEMFMAENYFDNLDYEKALNGDGQNGLGFVDIISDYKGTKSANLARYYAGLCELHLGHFESAIDYLKSYSAKDSYTGSLALMAQGDANAELKDNAKAISLYEKAAAKGDNSIVAPAALFKAAMLYIAEGNNDKAVKSLKQIKEKYPESTEYSEVDKYIAFAENQK